MRPEDRYGFDASRFDASDVEWSRVSLDNATHVDYVTVTTDSGTTTRLIGVPFCPDLIRYSDLGEADNMYGRVVRAFFWLMRWWR